MEIVAKKKWEKQALTPRGLPVRIPMHVKTNDKVVVIAGADKGKVTNVVEVFTKTGEVLCKDVNVKTKHVKPRGEGETGQIIQREFPIHHSNVMHYSEPVAVHHRTCRVLITLRRHPTHHANQGASEPRPGLVPVVVAPCGASPSLQTKMP